MGVKERVVKTDGDQGLEAKETVFGKDSSLS